MPMARTSFGTTPDLALVAVKPSYISGRLSAKRCALTQTGSYTGLYACSDEIVGICSEGERAERAMIHH